MSPFFKIYSFMHDYFIKASSNCQVNNTISVRLFYNGSRCGYRFEAIYCIFKEVNMQVTIMPVLTIIPIVAAVMSKE